jgi:SAM-dependent methyltransferase
MTSVWDDHAATFDDEPDHGLRDPRVRAGWEALLLPLLPVAPADVLDLGCGTGTLSVLLAERGHRLRGLDSSARMLAAARAKAVEAGVPVDLVLGEASDPPFEPASADVVLCRHVLWALADPAVAVARWARLLRPGGRLVLIEGNWSTGAGLRADVCRELVLRHRSTVTVRDLASHSTLWGRPVDDERYLLYSPA